MIVAGISQTLRCYQGNFIFWLKNAWKYKWMVLFFVFVKWPWYKRDNAWRNVVYQELMDNAEDRMSKKIIFLTKSSSSSVFICTVSLKVPLNMDTLLYSAVLSALLYLLRPSSALPFYFLFYMQPIWLKRVFSQPTGLWWLSIKTAGSALSLPRRIVLCHASPLTRERPPLHIHTSLTFRGHM